MEAKRKIKLELIVKGKRVFEARGKCNAIYVDQNTKVKWNAQKPDFEKFRIRLENFYGTLSEAYNIIFLATNSKYSNNLNYEIKTTIGRRRNDRE